VTVTAQNADAGSPALSQTLMTPKITRLIGGVNAAGGALAFIALLSSYGLAERMVVRQEASGSSGLAEQTLHWWGPDVTVTLSMTLMIVGAAAGAVGSIIQQSIIFAHRAGFQTLQRGFVYWYVLRPVWSALLGAVVVIAANAGFISIGDETTSSAGVTVLVTLGCLAGLFTDKALDRLRSLLGANDPATVVTPGAAPGVTS
jgi:hypothetical protein